jgi:hypothetical protein
LEFLLLISTRVENANMHYATEKKKKTLLLIEKQKIPQEARELALGLWPKS